MFTRLNYVDHASAPSGAWSKNFARASRALTVFKCPPPHSLYASDAHAAAVCTGQALVVTSGYNEHGEAKHTVDVMAMILTHYSGFTAAASLPKEISFSSEVTVCGDTL